MCVACYKAVRAQAGGSNTTRDELSAFAAALRGDRPEPHDYSQLTRVPGDGVVCSDVHAGLHDDRWLARVMLRARDLGLTRLYCIGDFLDNPDISRFPRERRDRNAKAQLIECVRVLRVMLEVFTDGIWIARGNHELRLEKLIHDAVVSRPWQAAVLADFEVEELEAMSFRDRYVALLERWTRLVIKDDDLARRIHWLPDAALEIEGPPGEKPWYAVHQGNGSRVAPSEAKTHWEKHGCPVITTHVHTAGLRVAPDGRHLFIGIGTGTREEWHAYSHVAPTGYPSWPRTALMMRGGQVVQWMIDNPYWSND